ncbi:MAG: insulinase family protein [Planctomycetes bacterium]|nr:insulinase family protein [Planctomycetota bacterium]
MSITVEKFPNGLTVAIEPISGMATASLSFAIPAGTAGDPDGAAGEGESTLLSELIVRGSGSRDSRAFSEAMDALGCERNTTVNANHVLISATMLASRLDASLGLVADMALRPRIDEEHLEPVRQLALQSLHALPDDPQHLVMLRLARLHLPPPFNRSGYGDEAGLKSLTTAGLRSVWKRRAVAQGSILSIAGAVSPEAALARARELFEAWGGTNVEAKPLGARVGGVEHYPLESSQTHMAFAFDAPTEGDPDSFGFRIAAVTLGGEASSRLFTEVREKRGLCYSVGASVANGRDRGVLQIYAGSTPQRAATTVKCILDELERFELGVNQTEFDRAKIGFKSRMVMQGESALARSSTITGDLYKIGRARTLDELTQALDAWTLDRVNDVIKRRMSSAWRATMSRATVGPDPKQPPPG